MKQLIGYLFPYQLYLHIFQLEHYELHRFYHWFKQNIFTRKHYNKKPLVITNKVKTIRLLSFITLLAVFILSKSIFGSWLIAYTLLVILILQPHLLITAALLLLRPYELWNRKKTIAKTLEKILSLKKSNNLKVIAIAGSYGKTSVKNILVHVLKSEFRVLTTPFSYNTIFGIAKVVELELDHNYDYFVCEIGEYYPGDIKELSEMCAPDIGIITGINTQHLERLGNIENTVATIFELADYLAAKNTKLIVNSANQYINQEISINKRDLELLTYGNHDSDTRVSSLNFKETGSIFEAIYKSEKIGVQTPLLGSAQIQNILAAITLGKVLGISSENIKKQLSSLVQIPHRFESKLLPSNLLLIDNSYSSNIDSFKEALNILDQIDRPNKILVTPGMVELGDISDKVHQELGLLANNVCTHIVLVGRTSRTKSLAESIANDKIIWLDDIAKLWQENILTDLDPNKTILLIENDLPDNY